MVEYVSHLASDKDNNQTACGEPWQGWQEPYNADLLQRHNRIVLPPMGQPRHSSSHGISDSIRCCRACLQVGMRSPV